MDFLHWYTLSEYSSTWLALLFSPYRIQMIVQSWNKIRLPWQEYKYSQLSVGLFEDIY